MTICGATMIPPPMHNMGAVIQCTLPAGHSGSHSYSDGTGGVSWSQREPEFPSVIEYNRQQARERRERIATAVLGHIIASEKYFSDPDCYNISAYVARNAADALMKELDK